MREPPHVFVSYARSSEGQANRVAEALRGVGYSVWRDDELPAHRSYAEVIEERLKRATAVVVFGPREAAKYKWVRAEADTARGTGTLVQASVDGTMPPIPFNQIQCADLKGWDGGPDSHRWQKLESSVASLVGGNEQDAPPARPSAARAQLVRASICVLPFMNMSGEPEQEYFSDGISEDITTDLSKISALAVVARNTAFNFKGQNLDVKDVAEQLSVSHVLEGSVRKAGNRIRIKAQLIKGSTGKHLWADRFDRDLTDIFEIQDEISKAIVDALKVKLLPAERKAIEKRGTSNVEAYNLYLMARQQWIGGALGKSSREEAIVRLCKQATQLDPDYAQAWALMALAQLELRYSHGRDVDSVPAADWPLEINPGLAEGHCVRARYLEEMGRAEDAEKQIRMAIKLDPASWEVNRAAAPMFYRHGDIREAIPFFEKATSLMDFDWNSSMMLVPCYSATGDDEKMRKSARTAVERAERAIAQDPTNGTALGGGAYCLAMAGDEDRARDWIRRALLLDPDNVTMRYNVACTLALKLGDPHEAIDALRPYFESATGASQIAHAEAAPALDTLTANAQV